MHFQSFSKVSKRAVCGATIYLGITREEYHVFLRLDTITAGSILLTANLVALKRGNSEPILIVKRTEWRKFIDCFGLIIEAKPSKVGKKKVYFV